MARDPDDVLLFDGFRFDRQAGGLFRVNDSGSASLVPLGSRALDLLALLARRNGETVTKEEIMTVVWSGRAVEEANLNVQVSKLRHILDLDRPCGSCIQTVTGYGYRFVADVLPVGHSPRSCIVGPAVDAACGTLAPMEVMLVSQPSSLDETARFGGDIGDAITPHPLPLPVQPGQTQIERDMSHRPASIGTGLCLISRLGAAGAIDEDLAAVLLDLRRHLIDDYGDGAAVLLLIEQVIAAYHEFIRVTGWIARLSAAVEDEAFGDDRSDPRRPDRDGSTSTGAVGHLAQLHECLVPLTEQCASGMRSALAALEGLRGRPAKE
jgi:DNA-binding winged helix-turn-helix (wHTH) protein